MKAVLRNILAVIAGLVIGSVVNMGFIVSSGSIIPPPGGADVTTMEGLTAALPLFEPRHFIFPFLAHAMGTLVGAAVATLIASSYKLQMAMVIGILFMAAGIANVMMLPSPMWFNVLDVAGAYLPMAWLGWVLAARRRASTAT